MDIKDLDILAMALGAVAVIFSGFVLVYSVWGGLALFFGGVLAVSIAFVRDRSVLAGRTVWVLFVLLAAAGVAGFLVGFGVFDSPDPRWEAEATLHDADTADATVIVTGTVGNHGDAAAERVTVTVTLYDADDETLTTGTTELTQLAPRSTQQFYLRFEENPGELSAFADIEVELDVEA